MQAKQIKYKDKKQGESVPEKSIWYQMLDALI